VPSRRARPGDTIIFYGIGFGNVTPNIAPGQVAQQLNTLTSPVTVSFSGMPGTLSYQGLAPSFVGLYQFNVVVPNIGAGDNVTLTFSQDAVAISQNLVIAVGN
jgi:uncharacterized protein (TIGR03437 family)